MNAGFAGIVGPKGAIAKSGKTIYDSLHETPELFLPSPKLESILRTGLTGLKLDYPIRTRSKILKSKVCRILGYPVPDSFNRTKPRFPGQDFDTYVQKADNLQIWNDEISPARRYVVVRLDQRSKVTGLRIVTGEVLAKLDTTGTLTKKYQAASREPVTQSVLVSASDDRSVLEAIADSPVGKRAFNQSEARALPVDLKAFLPIGALYRRLLELVGRRLPNPGRDQERNRGATLHQAICEELGMSEYSDTGSFPDVMEQLLEIKLQTAKTIDLGLVAPNSEQPLEFLDHLRHCDVRYAVFYGTVVGREVRLDHLVLARGADFFSFFQRFEGKVLNTKLQIPLPTDFWR